MLRPIVFNLSISKRAFLFALALNVTSVSESQTIQPPIINIPTSPEAAMLYRFKEIPIGYYTGTADISVPIYSVKSGDLSIPITLRYHSSGIKVADQATWVGLGWNLEAEGEIIQEVRGKSDEYDQPFNCETYFYNYFKGRFQPLLDGIEYPFMFLIQWGRSTAANECFNTPNIPIPYPPSPLPQDYYDTYCIMDKVLRGFRVPDIYNYSFGGYSGKFYKNPETGEIILIDRNKQIYFEIVNTSTIKATTLDGNVWTFNVLETANGGIAFEYTGKTYKLGSVASLKGNRIDFSYTDNTYSERALQQSATMGGLPGYPLHEDYSYIIHHKKTLNKITTSEAYVNFNISDRSDINVYSTDNLKKLSSIDVVSRVTNKKIKSFQFGYSYFSYNQTGVVSDTFTTNHADALGKRLKLDSLKEIGYTETEAAVSTMPPYKFEYKTDVTMPMKISFAKDFWGYYNGSSNSTLLPNLDYFDYFNQPEFAVINIQASYPYIGANRYANNAKAGAYMLNKITYPTGGYTEFEYEPNSFINQFLPDQTSNVHKNYDVHDNSLGGTKTIQFKLSKSTTIHFENSINNGKGNYNGATPLTYAQMQGCFIRFSKVKIVSGSPVVTLIKQWDLSTVLNSDFTNDGGKVWNEYQRVNLDPDPDLNYLLEVNFPDNLNNPLFASIAGVNSHISYYDDFGVDTTISNQGGMRIKTIKSFSLEGNIASNKLIKYNGGKLLNRFRPLTVYEVNHLDLSGLSDGIFFEYIGFYKKITASGNNFGLDGGNPIGYSKVEEIELAYENENNGKKSFTYLNEENKTGQDCPYSPALTNGLLVNEEIFDNLNQKLYEKIYTYGMSNTQPAIINFPCVAAVKLAFGSKVPCGNLYEPTPFTRQYYQSDEFIGSEFGFNAYAIHSTWYELKSDATILYSNAKLLTTTNIYTYNADGNMSTITTTNSKKETLITKYFYPSDHISDATADNYLISVHKTGIRVLEEEYKSSTLLSRILTVYGPAVNVSTMLPKFIYTKNGSNSQELRMTIDSYDEKGNITQYTPENNIPVSIVWNSDKTLPIAKVENATYSTLLGLPSGLNSDFRTLLPNARVTTFTYKPLIGVATITDANNKTNTYEYDEYGRPIIIKDQDGNIIKTFDYHYKQ